MRYVGKIVRCSDPGARSDPDIVSQKKTGIGIGDATVFLRTKGKRPLLTWQRLLAMQAGRALGLPPAAIPQRRIFVTFDGATVAWYTRGLKH